MAYINLRGFNPGGEPLRPAEALSALLTGLGVTPPDVPVIAALRTALYRELFAGRRVLVLLDNAADAERVRPLLPGTKGCLVIVPSRSMLPALVTLDGAYPLGLDGLTPAEGRRLLGRRLGDAA